MNWRDTNPFLSSLSIVITIKFGSSESPYCIETPSCLTPFLPICLLSFSISFSIFLFVVILHTPSYVCQSQGTDSNDALQASAYASLPPWHMLRKELTKVTLIILLSTYRYCRDASS